MYLILLLMGVSIALPFIQKRKPHHALYILCILLLLWNIMCAAASVAVLVQELDLVGVIFVGLFVYLVYHCFSALRATKPGKPAQAQSVLMVEQDPQKAEAYLTQLQEAGETSHLQKTREAAKRCSFCGVTFTDWHPRCASCGAPIEK